MMTKAGICAFALLCLPAAAAAHAIFPGDQTVMTLGDRAFVRLQAVSDPRDASTFAVEIFNFEDWTPSRLAVATPERFVLPPRDPQSLDASERSITVLVDLNGKPMQRLRICTKSVAPRDALRARATTITTRVCANVTVKRFSA